MTEWLHDLADWTVAFADSDWAVWMLALVSFSEAIFFPVPPDPLLIGIALVQQPLALWLALLVTVSSVAGALVGHWLGRRLGRAHPRPAVLGRQGHGGREVARALRRLGDGHCRVHPDPLQGLCGDRRGAGS